MVTEEYKNYINMKWDGVLAKNYDDMTITATSINLSYTYSFRKDKSYECIITSNNEIIIT